ncbi:MAG TPA: hypothetical protein VNO70_22155 [Blastocatellia bacterium]|nr:hypothetical protein [Blastocatellia bacterium]
MKIQALRGVPARFPATVSLVILFCLSALAAPGVNPPAAQSGTLTSATGTVTVNGAPAHSGASVASGSTISTGTDGDALIDMGSLGKLQLRPNTVVKLTYDAGSSLVEVVECGSLTHTVPSGATGQVKLDEPMVTQVVVARGEVYVNREDLQGKSLNGKRIKADKNDSEKEDVYNTRSVEARKDVETVYTVNCCQCCFVEQRLKDSN